VRVHILAVGRVRRGPERDLYDSYVRQIRWPLSLIEVEEKKPVAGAERLRREADLLLRAIPDGATVIALDERGDSLASRDFAHRIESWRDTGQSDIAFVIGGADGLDPSVRDRAALILSFGRQTWPHQMARIMLIEQIYRAQQILAGHPYHRD